MKQPPEQHVQLSPNDERLLDALVEGGFDPRSLEALSAEERQRVETLLHTLGLLHDYPVDDLDETLIDAAMARIDRFEDERAARLRFDAVNDGERPTRGRLPLPSFISVAAVILIAASIVIPVMSTVRQRSIDSGCANNMRLMGFAFGAYAGDYSGYMPMARAGLGGTWDTVRNSVNLEPLVAGGFCELHHLNCPGDHDHGMSYAYQWQVPDQPMRWSAPRVTIVMGDRNPLIDAYHSGARASAATLSFNHDGRGQNVLASDGGTIWLEQAVIGKGDNIWLPGQVSELAAGLQPQQPGDVFLAQ